MSLSWVVAGSLLQLMSAYLVFLLAVFAGGVLINALYMSGLGVWSYAWCIMTALAVIIYLLFIKRMRSS